MNRISAPQKLGAVRFDFDHPGGAHDHVCDPHRRVVWRARAPVRQENIVFPHGFDEHLAKGRVCGIGGFRRQDQFHDSW